MTKKDYMLIAKILKRQVTNKDNPELTGIITDFGNILKNDNSRFNKVKFMDYIYGGALYDRY